MHLTERQLFEYVNRTLRSAELLFVDDHLADCADCCKKLSSVLQANSGGNGAVNFLTGELAAAEEDFHLSFTQIVAYIDQQLDDTAQQVVTDHLQLCHTCQAEIEDLQTFKQTLSQPNSDTPQPIAPPKWWEALKNLRPRAWWGWPVIAVAGLVFIAIGFYRQQPQEPIALQPSVAPMPIGNSDSPPNVPAPLLTPSLAALSAEERAIQVALATGRLEIPAEIKKLRIKGGNLLSGKPGESDFVIVAPQGVMIESEQPRLQWSPLSGAKQYVVTITDQNFNEVARSQPLAATNWSVPVKLKRGELYQWQVTASTAEGKELTAPSPAAPEARFKVLSNEALSTIRRARQRYATSPLELGVLYARVGLLAEAERELQIASIQSPIARRLLKQLP